MSIPERLARISPFRWRIEWVLVLVAAVSGVLAEQAREARERDPYLLVNRGRPAQAIVTAPREKVVLLGKRRGEPVQVAHTLVDLEWQDDTGQVRRVTGYRLDEGTIAGLRPDAQRNPWPAYAQVLYLDRTPAAQPSSALVAISNEQGAAAPSFQQHCQPWTHCRLIVLTPDVLTPSEEAALNVDYVLDRAPHAFRLSIALLLAMFGLRLAGVVNNKPSLE